MKKTDQSWELLVKAARQAGESTVPSHPPYGFATRVTARWLAERAGGSAEVWGFLCRRAMLGAMLIMMTVVALNYEPLQSVWQEVNASGAMVDLTLEMEL